MIRRLKPQWRSAWPRTGINRLMRTGIEFYRHAFEHEIDANHAMLKMLQSVPENNRSDSRFQRALDLATHMVLCRQTFLDVFTVASAELQDSFEECANLDALEPRMLAMEDAWRGYLSKLDDTKLDGEFEFFDNGERWRMSLEAQLFQLVGHAAYHRGQVVLLVDSLGGETWDTDYIGWFTQHYPEGWKSL